MITEEMLRVAVVEADRIILESLPRLDECPEHTFSHSFERKMRKLLTKVRHPILIPVLRYVACIVVSIGVISGTWLAYDVEARENFLKWVRDIYENYVHYSLEGENVEPNNIEYKLSWIPDDFSEVEKIQMDPVYGGIFSNANGEWIRFNYTIGSDNANLFIYTEGAECERILINQQRADLYFYDGDDPYYDLVWHMPNGTQLLLSSSLEKEQIVKIAENVTENNF